MHHFSGNVLKAIMTFCAATALIGILAGSAFAKNILIYGPSLATWLGTNEQTILTANGDTVTVADAATWSAMTTADFASYDAIVFGDPDCPNDPSALDTAVANQATWAAAITGPVVVLGMDPIYHANRGNNTGGEAQLITSGVKHAASGPGIGLYFTLSCYYHNSYGAVVDALSPWGTFVVNGSCGDNVHILNSCHPAMAGLTDYGVNALSSWGCSTHAVFSSFPPTFEALARDNGYGLPCIVGTPAPASGSPDAFPPVTAASLSGTVGGGGWYRSPVSVSLSASDSDDGVQSTSYTVDGGAAQTYTGSFTVSGDGSHTVTYWSQDCSGNVEAAQTQVFGIDTASPATTMSVSVAKVKGVPVATISGKISDALSGPDPSGSSYNVYDEYGLIHPSGPLSVAADGTYSFTVTLGIPKGGDKDGREFQIVVNGRDLAGNAGSKAARVVVK